MGLLLNSASAIDSDYYRKKSRAERVRGGRMTCSEFESEMYDKNPSSGGLSDSGTSVFDPVLCELDYAWFTAEGDRVLDPFAGGSVRGVVAAMMGREYVGIDLRAEQIEANVAQAAEICGDVRPTWHVGDSLRMAEIIGDAQFDHVFTCPPYGDLERYSDDPMDISTMGDEEFDAAYAEILRLACDRLHDDRFATIVVGNYRDRKGMLRDLVGLTVRAMEAAGCRYYNDIILQTPVGSLPVRVGRQFRAGRKVGRTHQYVLNFVKGDPKAATARLGEVEMPDIGDGDE